MITKQLTTEILSFLKSIVTTAKHNQLFCRSLTTTAPTITTNSATVVAIISDTHAVYIVSLILR